MRQVTRTAAAGATRWLAAAVIVLALAYAVMLFARELMDPDEGRYAEIPREMVASGNWLEMRLLGYRYYEKPPWTYWTVAAALALGGPRAGVARLPLAANLLLTAALCYALVRRRWPADGVRAALLTMFSCAGVFGGCSVLTTDAFLTCWFSLACALLFLGFQPDNTAGRRTACLVLAALASGVGFLTKGAVAVVLPLAILAAWLAWERRARELLTPAWLPAGAALLALVLPVLWRLEAHNPGFFKEFIFNEHLARFTGSRRSQLHAEPFWFYLAVLPPLLLPWTLFGFRAWRVARSRLGPDSLTRFLAAWAAVVVVFFSAGAGKLVSYLLPAVPPLALLLGRWGLAAPAADDAADRRLWRLGLAGVWLTALAVPTLAAAALLGRVPAQSAPVAPGSAFLLLPLAAAGVALLAAGQQPGMRAALLAAGTLLSGALLFSPAAGRGWHILLHVNPANIYRELAARLAPADRLLTLGKYRPALAFYTRRLNYACYGMNELGPGILREPGRSRYLGTQDDLRRLVNTAPGRVFALMTPRDFEKRFRPLGLPFAPTDLPADPETVVLELRPGVQPWETTP